MFSLARSFFVFILMLVAMFATPAFAQEDDPAAISPLRLSYLEGDVGFWRYGAEDWTDARLNTPLAAGDALYVDGEGTLELQLSSRAFIRASDDSDLSIVNQTADFLQIKVTAGRVSLDLRSLPSGYAIELNTPNSVFTIERAGYYRVEVNGDVRFITRRGGQATMVPAGGQPMSVYPSEEIVVEGTAVARAETYVAPELDGWDRWNYDRTEDLIDVASERYLSSDIAGAADLDRYGRWRVVDDYGTVWVPDGMAHGWSPYSTGRWVWDPYYQWTWVDDAPWGWAPYHYGRWVYVSGYWAWAPGPVVRRAVYSPALVAFYGVGSGVSISIGGSIGWVALSWGEPLVPWWGRPHFVGRPYWGGWGGPRVVNNVVIKNTTIVNVTNITYVNTRVNNALVAVPRERFGKGYVQTSPSPIVQTEKRTPVRGALPIKPEPASVMVGTPGKVRPPESVLTKPVVATRQPREHKVPWSVSSPKAETRVVKPDPAGAKPTPRAKPEERYITVPKRSTKELGRPQVGERAGEERPRPPDPSRFNERRGTPPAFDSRSPREEEPREMKPLKEPKEPAAPAQSRQPDRPRETVEPREPRVAVPEAMPGRDREEAPQRMREPERGRPESIDRTRAGPEREQSMPQQRAVPGREREVQRETAPPPQREMKPERQEPSPAPARIERESGRAGEEVRQERQIERSAVPGREREVQRDTAPSPQREMMPERREISPAPARSERESGRPDGEVRQERQADRPAAVPGREREVQRDTAPSPQREVMPERREISPAPARSERENGRAGGEVRQERQADRADLPGNPANRMYRAPEKKRESKEQKDQTIPGK
ncbi:MAG: DUF6600 domain-containing protein [Methylophilaceae bacterium]|jgi:hypothetical protein|nr:DUF6600 domain-containing protein [Methylophilaceae bacterium]